MKKLILSISFCLGLLLSANAGLLGEWTFNTGTNSAERRASSNLDAGVADLSALTFNTFDDVGIGSAGSQSVPSSVHDGLGFGPVAAGGTVAFVHRADYFDGSAVPPKESAADFTSFGSGTAQGTTAGQGDGNAPISFTVTAGMEPLRVDSLTVTTFYVDDLLFGFQEAGATVGVRQTCSSANLERTALLNAPVVIDAGQTKTFTISLSSGLLNSEHQLDNISLNGVTGFVGTTIIWDDFAGISAGDNVSNSVLEVGSGTWSGRLISDGSQVVRAPDTPTFNEGASINLPDFDPGAVISIKARIGLADGADWWGIGFTDTPYAPVAGMSSNTPWAIYRSYGGVNIYGGFSTANGVGNLVRTNGAVSGVFDIEFIYDTGAETVTTIYDGEVVHENVAITTAGSPTLDYAFVYFYNATSGGTMNGTYVDHFEVTLLSGSTAGYATWAAGWGINIGAETDDYDEDGLINVYEYGLGGDPTNEFDQGTAPEFGTVDIGGTNYFGYIHPQLAVDQNSGLSYSLELNTDLVTGIWTNNGYAVLGTNVTGDAMDFVTNVTDTVDGKKFIRLIIE